MEDVVKEQHEPSSMELGVFVGMLDTLRNHNDKAIGARAVVGWEAVKHTTLTHVREVWRAMPDRDRSKMIDKMGEMFGPAAFGILGWLDKT